MSFFLSFSAHICVAAQVFEVRYHPLISSLQFVQQCLWPNSAQPPEVWKGSLDYSASFQPTPARIASPAPL
jgi:hypothetical protein